MITADVRRAALATFPTGTPLTIVAPEAAAFDTLVRERNDPAITVCTLQPNLQFAPPPYLFFEGIDDVGDVAAFLRRLRTALPATRLFALIANGGHLTALGAFFGGHPLARTHPYTQTDIAAVLAAGGWTLLGVQPLADASLGGDAPAPLAFTIGAITIACDDAATLQRGRIAAFLAVADPA